MKYIIEATNLSDFHREIHKILFDNKYESIVFNGQEYMIHEHKNTSGNTFRTVEQIQANTQFQVCENGLNIWITPVWSILGQDPDRMRNNKYTGGAQLARAGKKVSWLSAHPWHNGFKWISKMVDEDFIWMDGFPQKLSKMRKPRNAPKLAKP